MGVEKVVKDSRRLEDTPFSCADDICTADDKTFLFPKNVIIGVVNPDCNYGDASLSVDAGWQSKGNNCPEGKGSVTFGRFNKALGYYTSVTGGRSNTASVQYASVSGG